MESIKESGQRPLSDEWIEFHMPGDPVYYFNRCTKTVTWVEPDRVQSNWIAIETFDESRGRLRYYKHRITSEAVWKLPEFCAKHRSSSTAPYSLSWVEVNTNTGMYFWNYLTEECINYLPLEETNQWVARLCRNGSEDIWYYYEKGRDESYWYLPGSIASEPSSVCMLNQSTSWIERGAMVSLSGLQFEKQFNGLAGIIVGTRANRLLLKMAEHLGGLIVAVKIANVKPIIQNTLVEIHGLKCTNFNSRFARIVEFNGMAENPRYIVEVEYSKRIAIRSQNMKPTWALSNIGSQIFTRQCSAYGLDWNGERKIEFVDSGNTSRKFNMHVPLNFYARLRISSSQQSLGNHEALSWPLLVYLHGNDRKSFFAHSKVSLQSEGLKYAAQQFVVISPCCEWKWNEYADIWINELIDAFRAASWIDCHKIYLTGYSFGGMSCWEIASRRPDLYAAIVPVAAYHKESMAADITTSLSSRPIMVVHSTIDRTCLYAKEELLWNAIDKRGPCVIRKKIMTTVDHCNMFIHAYCTSTDIYVFLLSQL